MRKVRKNRNAEAEPGTWDAMHFPQGSGPYQKPLQVRPRQVNRAIAILATISFVLFIDWMVVDGAIDLVKAWPWGMWAVIAAFVLYVLVLFITIRGAKET